MRILFVGDIVGKGGRNTVNLVVPQLLREYKCQFCVANGENMAGGGGFTRQCLLELNNSGVDVFTSGDHIWDQKSFVEEIKQFPNVLRPANVAECQPGRGYGIFSDADGRKIGVICLLGRTFIAASANCPFEAAERIVAELSRETPFVVVDFHAEATSEKIAMGRFLDGKVSAVLGTHTHVPTADQQILPGGTAFQCDLGMVGARESILGRDIAPVVARFRSGMPSRFTVNDKGIRLNGAVVTIDDNGRAVAIERVMRDIL
jgi:metallophosphoesterase (TIGR00282 family)